MPHIGNHVDAIFLPESVNTSTTLRINGGDLHLDDDKKLLLGQADDLQIYHNGNHSYIDDAGVGNLYIRSGTLPIQNLAGTKTSATFNSGAGQELRFDNDIKFVTTATGIDVTGNDIKLLGPTSGSTFTTSTLTLRGFRQSTAGQFGNVDFKNIDANSANTEYLAARISGQLGGNTNGGELKFFVTPDGSTTFTSTPVLHLKNDSNAEFAGNLTLNANVSTKGLEWQYTNGRLLFNDNTPATFGTNGLWKIFHNGSVAWLQNFTGDMYFRTPSGSAFNFDRVIEATGGITTDTITGGSTLTIDPAAVGDNTGTVIIKGSLQVDGTTTTINSTTLTVDDLNIVLASGAANSAAANGAGITIDGANEGLTWIDSNKSFKLTTRLAIGSATSTSANLRLSKDLGGESVTTYYSFLNNGLIQPDVTGTAYYNFVQVRTDGNNGTGYTISNLDGYSASVGSGTVHADTTITNLTGFEVKNTWIEGTNNYGFRGLIDAADNTNRWNVYMDGTAPNYFEGNVGIGTNNPTKILHIAGNSTVQEIKYGHNAAGYFLSNTEVNRSGANQAIHNYHYRWNGTKVAQMSVKTGDDTTNKDNGYFTFETASAGTTAERLRITADGDVGIGTNNPSAKLHVDGGDLYVNSLDGSEVDIKLGIHATHSNFGIIKNVRASNSQNYLSFNIHQSSGLYEALQIHYDEGVYVRGNGYYDSIAYTGNVAHVLFGDQERQFADIVVESESASSRLGAFVFKTKGSSGFFPQERLRITSSGNVGLGTDNPQTKLDVYSASNSGASEREIRINASGVPAGGNSYGLLRILGNGNIAGKYIIGYNNNHTSQPNQLSLKNADGDITFYNANNASPTEKVRITYGGNVGIGTNNPVEKLHVTGNILLKSTAPFVKFAETGLTGSPVFWAGMDSGSFSIRLDNSTPYPFRIITKGTNNDSIDYITFGGDTIHDALKLTAHGTNPTYLDLKGNSANARMRYYEGSTERWNIGYDTSADAFTFYDVQSSSVRMFIYDNPNNGIVIGANDNGGLTWPSTDGGGATAQQAALKVDGGDHAALFCYNNEQSGDPVAVFAKSNEADDNQVVIIAGDGDGNEELLDIRSNGSPTVSNLLSFAINNPNSKFRVFGDGRVWSSYRVGIGTTQPASQLDIRLPDLDSEDPDVHFRVRSRPEGGGAATLEVNNAAGTAYGSMDLRGSNFSFITYNPLSNDITTKLSINSSGNVVVNNDLYVGGTTNYISSQPSGNYGTIQVNGSGKGNWEGYSIDGRAVFMHDGSTAMGLFDDVNNHWAIRHVMGNNSVTHIRSGNNADTIVCTGVNHVGIGTATVARGPLHIHEDTTGDNQIHMTNSETGTTSSDGFTIFQGAGTGEDCGFVNREENGRIRFLMQTGQDMGGNPVIEDVLTLTHTGNLGVKTTSPGRSFHVNGISYLQSRVGIGTTDNTSYQLTVQNTVGPSSTGGILVDCNDWTTNTTEYGINVDIDSTNRTNLTTNRTHRGIASDVRVRAAQNASNTNGTRQSVYGIYSSAYVDDTDNNDGKMYYVWANYARARVDGVNCANLRGGYFLAQAGDNATGQARTVDNAYGVYANMVNDGNETTFTSAYGVYANVNQDDAGGAMTNAYGVMSKLDRDAGAGGVGHLYRGDFDGTWSTKRGLWLTGDNESSMEGSFTAASKNFRIPHPLPELSETKDLVHVSVESPAHDLIYRGKSELVDGSATINLDTESGMTEGTFVALNRNIQCFTSNESDWSAVRGSVSGNILTIECQDSSSTALISWMVIGERQDDKVKSLVTTDADGNLILEPDREPEEPDTEKAETPD